MARTRLRFNNRDPRHGTANGYNNLGCRCTRCKAAWRIYCRPYGEAWRRRQGMKPQKLGRACGTISCYHAGCRCDECRRAAADQRRRQRAQKRAA